MEVGYACTTYAVRAFLDIKKLNSADSISIDAS